MISSVRISKCNKNILTDKFGVSGKTNIHKEKVWKYMYWRRRWVAVGLIYDYSNIKINLSYLCVKFCHRLLCFSSEPDKIIKWRMTKKGKDLQGKGYDSGKSMVIT
jgi:hypothetical protein